MGIKAAPQIKYSLIREALSGDNNQLKITMMCQIAGVSRAGYYKWIKAEDKRRARDEADRRDFELIMEAFRYRGYAKGARGMYPLFWTF